MITFEERMRAALHSRDSWRRALVEVALVHEKTDAGCLCGAKVYPCMTMQAIERANRGVARQVEVFCALSDEERGEALGDDYDYYAA
jgi:hypothetical protein